jgi:hypothetical protein
MDIYLKKAIEIHNNNYDYSLITQLPKRDTRVKIICRMHGEFEQSFHKHLCGDGCKRCANERLGRQRIEKASNKFKDQAKQIHNDKYDYSNSLYITAKDEITIICQKHGEFKQTPNKHLNGYGCKECGIENIKEKLLTPWNEYKQALENLHQNKYDYSKVIWKGVDHDIIVICHIHGDFKIRAADHKRGRGCEKCSKESHIQYNKLVTSNFIEKSIEIWGNKYDYSKTNYIGATEKVIIICDKHGEFEQLPSNHYIYGCGSCGREKNVRNNELKEKSRKEFVDKSNTVHKNKYSYFNTDYINSITKIKVTCKSHGDFEITPNNHLRGKGCPKCFNKYSKPSIQWLKYMEIKFNIKIQHALNTGEFIIPKTLYKADGYSQVINTIFEFHGDYWHGNPDIYDKNNINTKTGLTYGELYQKTIIKSKVIRDKGYNLIEIWETDWNKFIKSVRSIQKKWKNRNNENS